MVKAQLRKKCALVLRFRNASMAAGCTHLLPLVMEALRALQSTDLVWYSINV